jgi:hypothetical protein
MKNLALPFTFCFVWFLIAWSVDHFWFTAFCQQCSELFAFDFHLAYRRDVVTLNTDRVSGLFLFVAPLLIYAFVLIPYKNLSNREAWMTAFEKWSRPFFWLAMIAFWVWFLENIYGMFEEAWPHWFKNYAESYQMEISGKVLGVKDLTIKGKLGGLFGLLLGIYLFLSNGLSREA